MRSLLPLCSSLRNGSGLRVPSSNRTIAGTYIGADGLIHLGTPHKLRPNYVQNSAGLWVRSGWLREGAATNAFTSQTPTATDNTITVALDASAPFGSGIAAYHIMQVSAGSWKGVGAPASSRSDTAQCSFSFFIRCTVSAYLYLSCISKTNWSMVFTSGAMTSHDSSLSVQALGNSCYRVSAAVTYAQVAAAYIAYYSTNTDLVNGFWVGGFQAEDTAVSSFIPTTTAAVTRTAD